MSAQHKPGRWTFDHWQGWNAACSAKARNAAQNAEWLHGWDHFQRVNRAAIAKATGSAA